MRVYIASNYSEHTNYIYDQLKRASIDAFWSERININTLSKEEKYIVAERCFSKINQCNIILVVCPFGKKVASELGYAIALKRYSAQKIIIVALNLDFQDEAMLYPYVDKSVNDITQLIEYINDLKNICNNISKQLYFVNFCFFMNVNYIFL